MQREEGLMPNTPTAIQTVAGFVDVLHPRLPLYLEDLAVPASRLRRWTGHGVLLPNDVLWHQLHVVQILRRELGVHDRDVLVEGLLHDLHEAITGDMSRPMKLAMRQLSGDSPSPFDVIEARCHDAVFSRFAPGVNYGSDLVRQADAMSLGWEADRLFGPGTAESWGTVPAEAGLTGSSDVERYLQAASVLGCCG